MLPKITQSSKVAIVTHELFYGSAHALRDYLVAKNLQNVLFISHPLHPQNTRSYVQRFSQGKKIEERQLKRESRLTPFSYILDTAVSFFFLLNERKTLDLYVGVNPLNCFLGILLSRVGLVKSVVFYSIDFIPRRFGNDKLNKLYHVFEKWCVRDSNEVWNVSPKIAEGRQKFLHLFSETYPQKVVPIGVWKHDIAAASKSKLSNNTIVFAGHLLEKQGVQKVIQALPTIASKITDVRFLIIGGGEYEQELRQLVKTLALERQVAFSGWVNDQEQLRKLLCSCRLAVATYDPGGEGSFNFSYYADPTKIKTYLSCGLPVVMTKVAYNARDIELAGCGRVVKYNVSEIARAILSLLLEKSPLYRKRRALEFAKTFTWEKIFCQALNF